MSAEVWVPPGKWRFSNQHWDYVQVRSGVSIVTDTGGEARTTRAGDSLILRAGFQGTWKAVETARKEYVLRGGLSMPRFVRVNRLGEADALPIERRETPMPGDGEVPVSMRAIGLNRADVMLREGTVD